MNIRKSFRGQHGRDPEKELRDLQRRFRTISRRHDRKAKLDRFFCSISLPAMAAAMLYLGLASSNGWPPW